jgi:hypothetical protein
VKRDKLEEQLRAAFDRDVDSALPAHALVDAVLPRLREPRQKRWLLFTRPRMAWALLPLSLALIAAMFLWQPWNSNSAQTGVARAQAALAKLQSYRISLLAREGAGGVTSSTFEFAAPDRYYEAYTGSIGDSEEFILIGDQGYGKGMDTSSIGASIGMRLRTSMFSSMLTGEAAARMLDYLKDVEKFPDETVDGTVCLHYRGTIDFEKQYRAAIQHMQESNASKSLPPLSQQTQEQMLKEARSIRGSQVIDVWIGKSDYLMRQMKQDIHGPDIQDMTQQLTVDFTFFDFNQPITIEAPLDANGQLLPGWTSASR